MPNRLYMVHSQQDSALVARIDRDLRAAGFIVGLVDESASRDALYDAIIHTTRVVACLSEAALASESLQMAVYLARCYEKPALPVRLGACQPENVEATRWLADLYAPDFSLDYTTALDALKRGLAPTNRTSAAGSRKIHIGYHPADSAFVLDLARGLQEAGLSAWVDMLNLRAGEDYHRAAARSLIDASTMILCLSPEAATSPYIRRELLLADSLGRLVVPVVSARCMATTGCIDEMHKLLDAHPDTQPLNRAGWIFPDEDLLNVLTQQLAPSAAAPHARTSSFAPGMVIGPYEVLEMIGEGGMGEVYRGRHTGLNRIVAIKTLPAAIANEVEYRARFEREARTVAALRHPNIIEVFDFGTHNYTYYMVMEYVDGPDLAAHLGAVGRLVLADALPIIGEIGAALDHAHRGGVVHRDIKPHNILLRPIKSSRDGNKVQAILTDFGVTKIAGNQTQLTRTGMIGTIDYMAPEQIMASAQIDAQADVYAMGVVVYQMLTGHLPFEGRGTGQTLLAHVNEVPPDPREFAPDLSDNAARAILTALEKKPEARHSSAGEFAAALAAAPV